MIASFHVCNWRSLSPRNLYLRTLKLNFIKTNLGLHVVAGLCRTPDNKLDESKTNKT